MTPNQLRLLNKRIEKESKVMFGDMRIHNIKYDVEHRDYNDTSTLNIEVMMDDGKIHTNSFNVDNLNRGFVLAREWMSEL